MIIPDTSLWCRWGELVIPRNGAPIFGVNWMRKWVLVMCRVMEGAKDGPRKGVPQTPFRCHWGDLAIPRNRVPIQGVRLKKQALAKKLRIDGGRGA